MSKKLSKRIVEASLLAAAASYAGGAFATGSLSPDASGDAFGTTTVSQVTYAIEDLLATTNVTAPTIIYKMGVSRSGASQGFVFIFTLPTGVTFVGNPDLIYAGAGAPVISLKRGGAGTGQIVYSVDVSTTTVSATDLFGLGVVAKSVLKNSGLQVSGTTLTATVEVLDQGETACVDNVGTPGTCVLSSMFATSGNAADYWNTLATGGPAVGVRSDTGTVTDVNAKVPLAGFVLGTNGDANSPADTATVATATVQVKTSIGPVNAANTAAYALVAGDAVTVSLTDPTGFLGLKAKGLWYPFDGAAQDTANTFTVSGTTAQLAGLAGTSAGFNANQTVSFTSDAATPMGTSRVIAITGAVAPAAGTAHAFTGNSSFWTWTSNGTVLETPWVTTYTGYVSRYVFMNYGANDVTYSAVCLAETGNTVTTGSGANGTLAHGTQTVVNATDVCTTSGNTRTAVRFTINAPSTVVKGVYNVVNASSGSVSVANMLQPGHD